MTEPLLQVRGMGRSFGALQAVDSVDLDLAPGELHALIGPNGAGKTTLLDLLCGLTRADSGQVSFQGRDVTGLSLEARARLGLVRSFQVTSIFPTLTVEENLVLAVLAASGRGYGCWRPALGDERLLAPARELLDRVDLAQQAARTAADLSHGERRQLEVGMVLATRPALLLLDEPMAGLGPGGTIQLTRMIQGLKGTVTILLVEHDMPSVFALADRLTVLVQGRVAASGSPEEIRGDVAVQEAYLGGSDA